MEIKAIKEKLSLAEVLQHYSLKPDKNHRLNCPFHNDKTPSLQIYYKTQTAYCFSSNCSTHGKSLDVIDIIMHMEKSTKHEAIKKAESLITGNAQEVSINRENREAVLNKMFTYFKNAVHNSKPAQEYIQTRNLDATRIEIGYNTAQFHHGARKDEALIQSCVEVGLLTPWGTNSKSGGQAYKPFAKECICFALRNRAGQITGLYFRSTTNDKDSRHFYLKERQGLYPCYPKSETKKLILTESIIDAATLLQLDSLLNTHYSILSLYGTNGLTEEHIQSIKELKSLEEIIFFLNGDEAGKKATEKHAKQLTIDNRQLIISKVNVPDGEDVNSLMQSHEPGIFTHLLENRTLITSECKVVSTETKEVKVSVEKGNLTTHYSLLNTKNPYKLEYLTDTANYYIQGGISKMLDSMKVTLVIEHPQTLKKSRNKLDLYEDKQTERTCKETSEKLNLRKDLLEADIYKLIDLLDEYREKELNSKSEENKENEIVPLTAEERKAAEEFLKKENVIQRLNELLGKAGITGEEKNRIFLLLIALSYKMPETLHALIQGSSGSGKTRLLKQISDCIPQEKVTKLTRVSDKVLYNYPEKYFINRLLCLEDIDGLSEEAEFAFREL
ncbi:MAG: toprim domain-containing protein, partial [Flavobacterium sp.]